MGKIPLKLAAFVSALNGTRIRDFCGEKCVPLHDWRVVVPDKQYARNTLHVKHIATVRGDANPPFLNIGLDASTHRFGLILAAFGSALNGTNLRVVYDEFHVCCRIGGTSSAEPVPPILSLNKVAKSTASRLKNGGRALCRAIARRATAGPREP